MTTIQEKRSDLEPFAVANEKKYSTEESDTLKDGLYGSESEHLSGSSNSINDNTNSYS